MKRLLTATLLMMTLSSCRHFSPWEAYRSANILMHHLGLRL